MRATRAIAVVGCYAGCGGAWITGITCVLVDPAGPCPLAHLLSNTWPGPDTQG